jgi:hypothetical protein
LNNKVREHIAVKVLNTSLLKKPVFATKALPLGSYAPMPRPNPPFKIILDPVLWNGLQICRCITPDVINVTKMPSIQYFLYFEYRKKSQGDRYVEYTGCSNTLICLVAKTSLTGSAW